MTTRETRYSHDGRHTLLVLQGEQGAAQAEIWIFDGNPVGVIGLHHNVPQRDGQVRETCTVMGHCYPGDAAFRGGQEAAERYLRGDVEGAWAELEYWYTSRISLEVTL